MQHMFADDIFNVGRIKVWFYVTQNVYKRLPFYEREGCHELVLEWFSVFENQCPDICVCNTCVSRGKNFDVAMTYWIEI